MIAWISNTDSSTIRERNGRSARHSKRDVGVIDERSGVETDAVHV